MICFESENVCDVPFSGVGIIFYVNLNRVYGPNGPRRAEEKES